MTKIYSGRNILSGILIENWKIYIAAVFERRRFRRFGKCDNSLEVFGGNRSGGKLFVIEIFLMFNSEDIKNLSASITLYRIVTVTNLVI
jgi:hypothetical protein